MNAKEVGRTLVALRGEKTQEKVANDLGISTSALSMYEQGRRIPRDSVKIRIAKYYNTTVDYIFFTDNQHET